MDDDARARLLLAGPRGRRLCAELLGAPDRGLPLWWPERPDRRTALADVRDALARTDLDRPAHPGVLDAALQASVDRAMYWQEPDEVDAVLADDQVAAALAPVADAVVRAPSSQWWTEPVDRTTQHAVAWPEPDSTLPFRPAATTDAAPALDRWRAATLADERRAARERPADPRAAWSGHWWSTPALSGLVVTTRARPEDARRGPAVRVPVPVPVRLLLVEDEMGWTTARSWPIPFPAAATVYEITGPEAWTALVAQHPLAVTAAKRHDWWRATGWDGAWLIPDWAAVAHRFDAVHLPVDGYLSTAGRALPVPGTPARTVLAGWDPDATWWLTDVLGEPGPPTDWRREDDEGSVRWDVCG